MLAASVTARRASSAAAAAAAPFHLHVLRTCKWTWGGAAALTKAFEFRDANVASRFAAQVADLNRRLPVPVALAAAGATATVSVPLAGGAGAEPTAVEAAIAEAVDDVGGELQLGGRWN